MKNNKSDDVVTFLPTKLVSVLGGDGHLVYLADDYQVIGAALGHLRVALNLDGGGDGLVSSTRGQARAAEVKSAHFCQII